jgi:CheY-like chemotaxis protein
MRHQPTLFNQLKFPGSLAPGLRAEFANVVAEPVPEQLVALIGKLQRKLQAKADEAKADQAKTDQAKTDQAKTDQDKRRLTKSRTRQKPTRGRAKTRGRTETMGQMLQQNAHPRGLQPRRWTALIVEDDADLRQLSAALLEQSELDTIECESAEAALATMLLRGQDVAMIFADIRLPGVMDGVDLAREVKLRWPHLTVILTSGDPGERLHHLPPGVQYMPKPWQPLNVLMVAERARLAARR